MGIFWVLLLIVYLVAFVPALRTAVAFWLYRDRDNTANKAMKFGFWFGFLSIWFIYPGYIVTDVIKDIYVWFRNL